MNTYTPQLYSIDDDIAWKTYLDNYGFVVIKDILDDETYTDLFTQFYLDWSNVTPNFNFHDVNTWKPENSPMMQDIGMITGYGLGHAKFQWGLRTNENILNIWRKLHNTNDLVVSYDGFSVFFSPEQQPGVWLHVDQNPKDTLYSICKESSEELNIGEKMKYKNPQAYMDKIDFDIMFSVLNGNYDLAI